MFRCLGYLSVARYTANPFIPFRSFSRSRSSLSLASCISALQCCAALDRLLAGKKLHAWLVVTGLHASPFAITSLINFYSKCGRPLDAFTILFSAEDANIFAWNAAIAGAVTNGLAAKAVELFREVRIAGMVPDRFTLPSVINACSDLGELHEVRNLHACLVKLELQADVFVSSALVGAYIKMGCMEDAEQAFDISPERDVVLWNSMVNGFAQTGRHKKALDFFRRMGDEDIHPSSHTVTGIMSVFTALEDLDHGRGLHGLVKKYGYDSSVSISNSLIDMYGKAGVVEDATQLFETMSHRDIFSWNTMITVAQQSGNHFGALQLFIRMRKTGMLPDAITLLTILPACTHTAALIHGRLVHGLMEVYGIAKSGSVHMENAIMDMYAKCGRLCDARLLFDRMHAKDVASWNILISGYAAHGQASEAFSLFHSMYNAGVTPDSITFVTLLSACSHSGLVDRGREILENMSSKFKVVPSVEHYCCVVDMLGRAGRLAEAYDLLLDAQDVANQVVWRAYLSACQVHGDMGRAVNAAKHLLELEPEHCGSYVLLSNAYGSVGKYEEVSEVRLSMRNRNVKKKPGLSWIELESGIHAFVSRDKLHPESEKIYSILCLLTDVMREMGYAPDSAAG